MPVNPVLGRSESLLSLIEGSPDVLGHGFRVGRRESSSLWSRDRGSPRTCWVVLRRRRTGGGSCRRTGSRSGSRPQESDSKWT